MTALPRYLAAALAACLLLSLAACSADDANLYDVLGLDEEDTGPPPETVGKKGAPVVVVVEESEETEESEVAAAPPNGVEEVVTIDLNTAEVFFEGDAVPGEPEAAEAEFRCYRTIDARISVQVQRGKIPAPDQSQAGRRACVYAALCDVIDGQPNYFANLMAAARSAVQSGASGEGEFAQQQAFAETCRGLPGFGRDMMLSEEALFLDAVRTRNDLRGMYATQ
ncbi:MAG: hypothetical protein HOH66_18085 [Rhodospirillaceae bacterium]|nr:hypothetical protein [Rhodospirillaceae bacterium]